MLTTIHEIEGRLPVGCTVAGDGPRDRTYSFRPWRSAAEIAIGKDRDAARDSTPGQVVGIVLAHILKSWGGVDFDTLTVPQRRALLTRSYAADVYAAWVQLRREVVGNIIEERLLCGLCRKPSLLELDLGTVEVGTIEDDDPLDRPYTLQDGLPWRGEERFDLTLRPLRWAVYESVGRSLNLGLLKLTVMAGAVFGIEGVEGETALTPEQLDLTKRDLEALARHIDGKAAGPVLSIEENCPHCDNEIKTSVTWVYDPFFSAGGSSLSAASTKSGRSFSSSPTASPASTSISTTSPPKTEGTSSGSSSSKRSESPQP